jgi:hypothetical protein
MKYLLGLSLTLNVLIAWWGHGQVKMGQEMVAIWENRDHRRQDSIQVLSALVIHRATKAEVAQVLTAAGADFFDKAGKLEAGDLSFSYQGDDITRVEAFQYKDKTL